MTVAPNIAAILKTVPSSPGVYQYFDDKGEVIYVGKAKNLTRRVHSYFNKEQTGKTRVLVSRIADIKFIVVNNESEALLLENNLIKRFKPRYNILLKDDKTYPWICIKNEAFPRVFLTRRKINDGSLYFGPYPSVVTARTLLDLIRRLYPIRTCSMNLSGHKSVSRPCLEYQVGNCNAPCVGYISDSQYNANISEVKNILNGNVKGVLRDLKETMMDFASRLEFEKAQAVKVKYDLLENYHSRSVVSSNTLHDVEVVSFDDADTSFYINYMRVVQGSVVCSHSLEIKRKLEETADELLLTAIFEMRQRYGNDIKEVIVPLNIDFVLDNVAFTVPSRGEKLTLLTLSQRNARQYRAEVEKLRLLVDPERHAMRILEKMKSDLRMPVLPEVIECFDNSNFQGDYPVAAMVQFVNAKPNKDGYRHFNIKTVQGPNDYASMEEIVFRRYRRLLDENQRLPDLIVVDGGKGQITSAVNSLQKLGLYGKITLIGIAEKLEEIYYPGDELPLCIDKRSETLKVIQHIRDEAHRFGITHHRKKFEKGFVKSELNGIKGIGRLTAEKLLLELKSVKQIKEADREVLERIIGKAKADIVWTHFHLDESQIRNS